MMNTNELARMAHSIRIFRKRFVQEVMPKSRKPLISLEPLEGEPVVAQLRALLANKAQAKRMVEQFEIWDTNNDRHISRTSSRLERTSTCMPRHRRCPLMPSEPTLLAVTAGKEFRRAFAFLGYTAPKHDMNILFDEFDADGSGEGEPHASPGRDNTAIVLLLDTPATPDPHVGYLCHPRSRL